MIEVDFFEKNGYNISKGAGDSMRIEFSKAAAKFIKTQDSVSKQRLKDAICKLTENPPMGDIKQLQGYATKTYRLRVGKYRIIYRYDFDKNNFRILFISDIDSRGDIYK